MLKTSQIEAISKDLSAKGWQLKMDKSPTGGGWFWTWKNGTIPSTSSFSTVADKRAAFVLAIMEMV